MKDNEDKEKNNNLWLQPLTYQFILKSIYHFKLFYVR